MNRFPFALPRPGTSYENFDNVEFYTGIVETVDTPDPTPLSGPASAYSYGVRVNLPTGSVLCNNMKPVIERWDDSINVLPLEPNTPVIVASVLGELQLMAREIPSVTPCGAARGTQPSFQEQLITAVQSMTPIQKSALKAALWP